MGARFDVVVVGAGHAGCEAALACARLGARVGLVTLRGDAIAQMSCNPAIGGVGKGQLVREVDALGGMMGRVADATGIQFRRLNQSRGPAVQSTRAQSDADKYRGLAADVLAAEAQIDLIEDEVVGLRVDQGRVRGVETRTGGQLAADGVVVTTGTFLNGLCHVGEERFAGGRIGDGPATGLSAGLADLGLRIGRLKTGTTPRVAADSVAWSELEAQHGDDPRPRFSFARVENDLEQVACHIGFTNSETHEIIRGALDRSPLFCGQIQGRGPRYCPSIEDKVVRFADRERHQLFLEPEGLDTDRIYVNGLSTSMPREVQEAFVHSVVGLKNARIVQFGYAVEYDFVDPIQLGPDLMVKGQPGLFLAGQINGTSGYEEAAAQGLMAGLGCMRFLGGQMPAVLSRAEAYIGVMIDDLVTKGVDEPYRMFTSRAEHRLVLRETNAEMRLWKRAAEWGLTSRADQEQAAARERAFVELHDWLKGERLGRARAEALGLPLDVCAGLSRAEILRRPGVDIGQVLDHAPGVAAEIATLVAEEIKYEGYIQREEKQIARLRELEGVHLPRGLAFGELPGLSRELREKLSRVQPRTLGQASRIPGMTPAAVAILRVWAKRGKGPVSRETLETS